MRPLRIAGAIIAVLATLTLSTVPTVADDGDETFTNNEIVRAGSDFFGSYFFCRSAKFR